jgi:hypothetical protein
MDFFRWTRFVALTLTLGAGLYACGDTTGDTGGVDAVKADLGGPCNAASDCESGTCPDGVGYCSQACEINQGTGSDNCPDGFRCDAVGEGAETFCLRDLSGTPCETDANCPIGHTCAQVDGAGLCVLRVNTRGACAACDVDAQCANGKCVDITPDVTDAQQKEKICAPSCTSGADCPLGFDCSATLNVCLPGAAQNFSCSRGRGFCASCRSDNDCGGPADRCLRDTITGRSFCTVDCSINPADATACPTGAVCRDVSAIVGGDGVFQCVPAAGGCSNPYCSTDAECRVGTICGDDNRCVAATDGRLCTECKNDDNCPADSRCVVATPTKENANSEVILGESFCSNNCRSDNQCPLGFGCLPLANGGGRNPTKADCAAGSILCNCIPNSGSCRAGAAPIGSDCSGLGASACRTGLCLDYAIGAYCTGLCNVPTAEEDAKTCTTDEDCVFGARRLSCNCSQSEACNAGDAGCENGRRCTARTCGDVCPAGYKCTADTLKVNDTPDQQVEVCLPVDGQLGADCRPGQPICQSGICLDLSVARVCSQECTTDSDCAGGSVFRCGAALNAANQVVNVCVPKGGGQIGDACQLGADQCESQLCLERKSGNLCTRACETDSDCDFKTADGKAADWVCKETQLASDSSEKPSVCVPTL